MIIAPVCYSTAAGGAEHYLKVLYPGLARRGFHGHLIGSVPGWEATGLPWTSVGFSPKWSGRSILKRLPRLPAERREVSLIADRLGADLFHAQFKREQIGLTGLLSRHAPVIWTEHGKFPTGPGATALRIAYRQAARDVAAILCVSPAVADEVRRIVGPRVRLELVPNAIDTKAVCPPSSAQRAAARESFGLPQDVPVLAWMARTSAGKLPLLAATVGLHFPGITLMAGRGEMDAALAENADGQQVRLLGFQSDPLRVLHAADVFLFTSDGEGEGCPYSLLEAAACNLPIVVNASSGIQSVVAGAGATMSTDDPQRLAQDATMAATGGGSRAPRDWAIRHDVTPWLSVHAALMSSASESA